MKNKLKSKGLTLIEMVVVISIVSLLTTIFLANYRSTQRKNRDEKRKADVNQLKLAANFFAEKHKKYPDINSESPNWNGTEGVTGLSFQDALKDYIDLNTLEDPYEGREDYYKYTYEHDSSHGCILSYYSEAESNTQEIFCKDE